MTGVIDPEVTVSVPPGAGMTGLSSSAASVGATAVGGATTPVAVGETAPDAGGAVATLDRAVDYLYGIQYGDGHWRGLLETNVTMDAEDVMMRRFLGILTDDELQQTARWIRGEQREDGSWANFRGGPADPSTTAEAYVALKMAGDPVDAPHMVAARAVVLGAGGLAGTRVFTRMWLALFGLWDWREIPALPPEIVFLGKRVPLNLYDFACWARQTIAPLTILSALRPRRDLRITVDELRGEGRPSDRSTASPGWSRFFRGLDSVLHGYERLPRKPLRGMALRRTAEWIIARQEADGSWGGIQPPWVYSLMALSVLGYPNNHPVMARGLEGWERFTVRVDGPRGPMRWIEACQSPVWDTALATVALGDARVARGAGVDSDARVARGAGLDNDPHGAGSGVDSAATALATDAGAQERVEAAVRWLLREEITVSGDWAVQRPHLRPGGWAFEYDNDGYPDIDDTAEVVLGLRKLAGRGRPDVDAAITRGIDWVLGMQSSDGGWGAFDADNTRELAYQLPFCDFGAVIDPPSADVTAHVVEMLAEEGFSLAVATQRGVRWLLNAQEADGSWFGRWGANYLYGTGAVVPALVAAGVPATGPEIRRAVAFLERVQNQDGGWGEDLRSYTDPDWSARGESTASQTAWALLALHAAGEADSAAARRGVDWLSRTQRTDGGWDEPQFTGTGFPGDFYINYHLYRQVFPISALARCLAAASESTAAAAPATVSNAGTAEAAPQAPPTITGRQEDA